MRIDGNRIYLRDYKLDDFERFYKLISDPGLRELSLLNTPENPEKALAEFNMIIAEQAVLDRKRFIIGGFLKDGDVYIADAGFEILKRNNTGGIAEIGYFLDKNHRGFGYASEIALMLTEYCFTKLKMHKVIASCDKRNKASEKVMIKCGMKKEAESAKQRYKGDEWHDELKYGILKEDWDKSFNPRSAV